MPIKLKQSIRLKQKQTWRNICSPIIIFQWKFVHHSGLALEIPTCTKQSFQQQDVWVPQITKELQTCAVKPLHDDQRRRRLPLQGLQNQQVFSSSVTWFQTQRYTLCYQPCLLCMPCQFWLFPYSPPPPALEVLPS